MGDVPYDDVRKEDGYRSHSSECYQRDECSLDSRSDVHRTGAAVDRSGVVTLVAEGAVMV